MIVDLIGRFIIWQTNCSKVGKIVSFEKTNKDYLIVKVQLEDEQKVRSFVFPDAFIKEPNHLVLENGLSIYDYYENDDEIMYISAKGAPNGMNDIDCFIHYTDIKNLASILNSGFLYSRRNIGNETFYDAANQNVISNTREKIKDYVRFFYKENTPTIYNNAGIKAWNKPPHMPIPVMLFFDRSIMLHENVIFSDGSGSSNLTNFTGSLTRALKFNWKEIFSRTPYPTPYNSDINEHDYRIIKNHRNAEFLYPSKISLKYLKKVVFRSISEYQLGVKMCGCNSQFAVDYDKKYFYFGIDDEKRNCNFVLDYIIFNKYGQVDLIIEYDNDNIENFEHTLVVDLTNNKREKIECTPTVNAEGNYEIKYNAPGFELVKRMRYYMNGHLCIIWEDGE